MKNVSLLSVIAVLLILPACKVKQESTPKLEPAPKQEPSPRIELVKTNIDTSCTEPNWQIADVKIDDSCSRLLDFCVRISCEVNNLGENTEGTVIATLFRQGGSVHKEKSVRINATSVKTIQFDFDEAKLEEKGLKGQCDVNKIECAKVQCELTNTGDARGTALVTASFTGYDGQTKSEGLNLAPGQTRTLEFEFKPVKLVQEAKAQCLISDISNLQ